MTSKGQQILEKAFAEQEPFLRAKLRSAAGPNHWALEVEIDLTRVSLPRDQRVTTIEVFFDEDTEILTFWSPRLRLEGNRILVERQVNRLNCRKDLLSRMVVPEGNPLSVANIYAVNISYIDPQQVTGFEAALRHELEFLIGEATRSHTSLLVSLS